MYHFQELKPIFSRLADISLLASCGRGLTQSCNESLHRLVWSFVPKEQFNSPNEVQLGIDLPWACWSTTLAEKTHCDVWCMLPICRHPLKRPSRLYRFSTNETKCRGSEGKAEEGTERTSRSAICLQDRRGHPLQQWPVSRHFRCDASCSTVPDLRSAKEGPPPGGLPIGKMWSLCYGCYFCTELGCYDELRCLM